MLREIDQRTAPATRPTGWIAGPRATERSRREAPLTAANMARGAKARGGDTASARTFDA